MIVPELSDTSSKSIICFHFVAYYTHFPYSSENSQASRQTAKHTEPYPVPLTLLNHKEKRTTTAYGVCRLRLLQPH